LRVRWCIRNILIRIQVETLASGRIETQIISVPLCSTSVCYFSFLIYGMTANRFIPFRSLHHARAYLSLYMYARSPGTSAGSLPVARARRHGCNEDKEIPKFAVVRNKISTASIHLARQTPSASHTVLVATRTHARSLGTSTDKFISFIRLNYHRHKKHTLADIKIRLPLRVSYVLLDPPYKHHLF